MGLMPFFGFSKLVWRVFAIWPLNKEESPAWKVKLHNIYKIFVIMLSISLNVVLIIQIIIDRNKLEEVSDGLSIVIVCVVLYSKWATVIGMKNELKIMMESLENNFLVLVVDFCKEKQDIIRKYKKHTNVITVGYGAQFFFCVMLFIAKTIVARSKFREHMKTRDENGTERSNPHLNMLLKAYYPMDTTDPFNEEIVFWHQSIACSFTATTCALIDTLYFALMIALTTQFKLLNATLCQVTEEQVDQNKCNSALDDSDPLPAMLQSKQLGKLSQMSPMIDEEKNLDEVDDDTDTKNARNKKKMSFTEVPDRSRTSTLLDCILYHQRLLKLGDQLRDILSPSLFVQYLTTSIGICFGGFQAAQMPPNSLKFLTQMVYTSCLITQLGLLCWYANEIDVESGKVRDAAYRCIWYNTSPMFKYRIQNMIRRTEKLVVITAGKFGALSLEMFTGLLRTSYSYFALLRQLQQDN